MKLLPKIGFFFASLALCCPAEEWHASLAPYATKQREESAKFAKKAEEAVRYARDAYLVALDSAETEATNKSNGTAVAAIGAERHAAKVDALAQDPPEALPRKVIPSRKAFQKALNKAQDDLAKELKKLNTAYLAALNKIPGTAEDSVLSGQITAEKKRLLTDSTGPVGDLQADIVGTRWRTVSKPEEVMTFGKDGKVNGIWKYSTPAKDEVIIVWDETASVTLKLARNGRMLLKNGEPNRTLVMGDK
jgi:hypothetical protein